MLASGVRKIGVLLQRGQKPLGYRTLGGKATISRTVTEPPNKMLGYFVRIWRKSTWYYRLSMAGNNRDGVKIAFRDACING